MVFAVGRFLQALYLGLRGLDSKSFFIQELSTSYLSLMFDEQFGIPRAVRACEPFLQIENGIEHNLHGFQSERGPGPL